MKKVQAGDLSKMGLLYERYSRDLFGYFYRCTGDRTRSEDLVQNVFERIIKYSHTFAGHGEFSYWLFATARNVWFDQNRRKQRVTYQEEIDEEAHPDYTTLAPDETLHRKERHELLQQALQELSPEKREAIVLSRYQGFKYKEIAKMADCSENAIKSRVQRGLIELRELVEKLETTS